MKRLDPRSVIIGFLVAVIGFMSIGANNSTFESITVNEIRFSDDTLAFTHIGGDSTGEPCVKISKNGLNISNRGVTTAIRAGRIYLEMPKPELKADISSMGITFFGSFDTLSISHLSGIQQQVKGGGFSLDFRSLEFHGLDGKKRLSLGYQIPSIGYISLYNQKEKEVVFIGETENNDGIIELSDRYGDYGWQASGKRK